MASDALPALPVLAPSASLAERSLIDADHLAKQIEVGAELTAREREAVAAALRTLMVPPARPGQRSLATRLGQAEHQHVIRVMARRFYPQLSASAAATCIARRLALYRGGADWARDRGADHVAEPESLRGFCWRALKAYDRILSVDRIRKILGNS